MKKLSVFLSLFLTLSLLLSPAAFAADDTLADWDIRIAAPDDAAARVLEGNTYYIYAQNEGYIPYVMLMATGQFDSEEEFIGYLSESLAARYQEQGFEITSAPEQKTVGGRLCREVDFAYTISGYDAVDRRIFITVGDLIYMFCSKEIPSLGMTVDGMLEEVIENAVFLSEGADTPTDPELPEKAVEDDLFPVYLYREENGMPKYWLDLTGLYADHPVLHCYFRSGDPTFYESVFILDFDTAEIDDDTVLVYDIYDARGNNVSDWFNWFELSFEGDYAVMDIGRNEKTLAGGAEDNLLTGVYKMEPCAANACYECCDENGELRYWMVPNEDGDIELHGTAFYGGDPETYEEVYVLDSETAVQTNEYVTSYTTIYRNGSDVSKSFKSVVLSQVQSSYILAARPADKAAGGQGDGILLSGSFTFDPAVRFVPAESGPYTEEELGLLAQQYYFLETGFYPPEAEVNANEDGSFSIHLYEVVETNDIPAHTATSAWYTVDPFGVGLNDVTGDEVYLAG